MSISLVTYNATTGELRSNPKGFARVQDYVASIVWEKRKNDPVRPGDQIATIQWGRGAREVLCVPEGCSGRISDLNRTIILEELEYEPSQYLARFA